MTNVNFCCYEQPDLVLGWWWRLANKLDIGAAERMTWAIEDRLPVASEDQVEVAGASDYILMLSWAVLVLFGPAPHRPVFR